MAMTLISTSTASSSTELNITSGIDNTYKLFIFNFVDIHPSVDGATFKFQVNASGQSGYNETMTTTTFNQTHTEAGVLVAVAYQAGGDQAQGTAYQTLCNDTDNDNDSSAAGTLHLFNPSNTTYVTHFWSRFSNARNGAMMEDLYAAGYINVTAAITNISFKFSAGNIDAGSITMYGVS